VACEPEKVEPFLSEVEGGVMAAGSLSRALVAELKPIIPNFVKKNTT